MDALKFRKRPLFRQQAVDRFIGVHGDGRMPELLHPGRWLVLRVAQAALILGVLLWITGGVLLAEDSGPRSGGAIDVGHD